MSPRNAVPLSVVIIGVLAILLGAFAILLAPPAVTGGDDVAAGDSTGVSLTTSGPTATGSPFDAPASDGPSIDGAATDARGSDASASQPAAGGATAAIDGAPAAQDEPTVVERVVYRQRADGDLAAEVVYEVPDGVSALEFRFEEPGLAIQSTDGFERTDEPSLSWSGSGDGPTFAWDGETASPRVVVRHGATLGTPASRAGGTDDWAVVRRPPTHARWRYDGPEPAFAYDAAVDGDGVAGEQFFALGPHEVHETTVDGERIRLVVPGAAEMASEPERVLATIADASRYLQVGERSDVVTIVASPSDIDGARWAHRGLSLGPDARVDADVSVDDAPNLWIHEYVHTRQDRSATTPSTEWLVEATAEYYAATVAFERGDVDYEAYRRALADGATGASSEAVLSEPDSWAAQAQYHKGALVVAAIDRELRASTGGDATFQDVVHAWNSADEFTAEDVALRLDALGGAHVRSFGERHATTSAVPEPWTRRQHRAIFDVAPGGDGAGGAGDGTALAAADGDGAATLQSSAPGDRAGPGDGATTRGDGSGADDGSSVGGDGPGADDGSGGDGPGADDGSGGDGPGTSDGGANAGGSGPGSNGADAAVAGATAAGDALEDQLRQLRRSAGLAMVAALLAGLGLCGVVVRP